ncbi:hypothetical protein V5J35_003767 [Endozoicomonas sp. NE40]|uniref:Uncharacterized protein n=1 Tax=Endozoicomonas lisbonensis TaxID=3120522 RepID=A0ABV2SLD4_9GAMM
MGRIDVENFIQLPESNDCAKDADKPLPTKTGPQK